MGTFLSTVLVTEFSTSKSNLDSFNAESDRAKKLQLQKLFLGTDMDIFDIEETDSSLIYQVKKDVLQDELIPFLRVFYNDLHGSDDECDKILDRLKREADATKWIEIAEAQEFYKFQLYTYGQMRFSYKRNRINIGYNSIMLGSEGKIMMEQYGLHFSFMEFLIKKVYSKYKLAFLIKIDMS